MNIGHEVNALAGYKSAINALAFNADSSLLASGSDDDTIVIWQLRSSKLDSIGARAPKANLII